jgi:N4-gp56 family major capsid protein
MSQLWAVNSLGGYMSAQNLSKVLRMEVAPTVKFRQFCDARDASMQGLHKGQTYHWNKYSKVAVAGGTLSETQKMPETNITISQGTLSIQQFGNSVPYTGLLDNLSEHPIKEIIKKSLKIDARDALDTAAHTEFAKCKLRAAAATDTSAITLTTNGTATVTNTVALGTGHVKTIVDTMKERNIPPYEADDYYALAWPTTFRTFHDNLEGKQMYTESGFGMIKNGEKGRYYNCRFVEQTNVTKGTGSTANAAWGGAKSDWCFFFGDDTVAEAIAIPEEIRGKIPTQYGLDMGIAWYALLGFGLIHDDALNSRIVMWDSAA